jgi:N-acylneuraminate cytidylyltransferase
MHAARAFSGLEINLRPSDLATSTTSTVDVLRYLIQSANLQKNWLVLTQLTSPLRFASDIRETIRKAKQSKSQSAVSVTRWRIPASGPYGNLSITEQLGETHDSDWQRTVKRGENSWAINGAVYACNAEKIINSGVMYDETSAIHIMPLWRSIDIDYPEDLEMAARLASTHESKF